MYRNFVSAIHRKGKVTVAPETGGWVPLSQNARTRNVGYVGECRPFNTLDHALLGIKGGLFGLAKSPKAENGKKDGWGSCGCCAVTGNATPVSFFPTFRISSVAFFVIFRWLGQGHQTLPSVVYKVFLGSRKFAQRMKCRKCLVIPLNMFAFS